jgi:anti-sigma factor (TIGR02949 family)
MMPMLDCSDVMRQLWDYLDHELTPDRMDAVAAHLAVCHRCYPQYNFERAFLRALKGARDEGLAPPALHGRVLAALHEEGLTGV